MPSVVTSIPYLATNASGEKPYAMIAQAGSGHLQPEDLTNVNVDLRPGIHVADVRHTNCELSVNKQGFTMVRHPSLHLAVHQHSHAESYRKETEELLKSMFDADDVQCWDLKRRLNEAPEGDSWNYNDQTQTDRPIEIAHCDHTFNSGIDVVGSKMSTEKQLDYLNGNYRIRMVKSVPAHIMNLESSLSTADEHSTWRLTNTIAGDQPLALCDCSTIEPEDLVLCDRIVVNHLSEMYMLQYSPKHRWYWTDQLTRDKVYIWVSWDSEEGDHPKCKTVDQEASFALI